MIKSNNAGQTALLNPTIGEPVPDKLELYGVDSDGPLPPEHQSCIEVEPPTSNIT